MSLAVAREEARHVERAAGRIGALVVGLHVGQEGGERGLIGRCRTADGEGHVRR